MSPTDFAMTKQILKLQKTLVQNNIKTQALWLNHGERFARTCFEQTGMMPDEARQTWECGSDLLKSGRQTLEAMVDAQFAMIAGWFKSARTQS